MTIKSVRPLSLAKILASIYATLGLVFGSILAFISLLGLGPAAEAGQPAVITMLLSGGAVIALPLFYGLMGFIGGLLVGAIYNLVARFVGGIEIEVV